MTVTKCAIYARTSTGQDSEGKGQTPENQIMALREEAKRRGWTVTEVYTESETAWRAGHQHELARAIADAKRARYDVLLCWALDRLSREGSLATLKLVDTFGKVGVRVVSMQEPWTESAGDFSPVLLAIAGWVAKMESQRKSERVKASLVRVRLHGSKSGREIGKRGPDKKPRLKRSARVRYVPTPV